MGLVLNPFTGQLDITGGSATTLVPGTTPIIGGTPNSFLYDQNGKVGEIGPLANGELFIGSTGNPPATAPLTGTANQVVVTNGPGSITLSLPQSIATTSSPTFSDVTLTSLSSAGVVLNSSAGVLSTGQVNLTTNVTGVLPIVNGGTNSSTPLVGSKAIVSNSTSIVESNTTATEISYVSGVTSSIQTQLNSKVNTSSVGMANGVASLDGGGKVPVSQLPNSVLEYQGNWNPSTNTPALSDGTGTQGNVYRASVAYAGPISGLNDPSMVNFQIGNLVIYNGTVWQQAPAADGVVSVNGMTGAVILTTSNIAEGTNLYYTDTRAENAVGGILANSSNISLSYSSNTIKADLIATGVPAGTYGGATSSPVITVDTNGRLTNVTTTTITGTTPGGAARGDLSGTYPNPTVAKIQGTSVSNTPPTDTQILLYNNSLTQYTPVTVSGDATLADSGALTLITTGVTAGTYGSNNTVPQLVIDSKGRVTSASSVSIGSAGDIPETAFLGANNVSSPANVTGLAFSNTLVRSFKAQVSIYVSATTSLYQTLTLIGVQRGSDWSMSYSDSVGDSTGISFSITTSGQLQYVSPNYPGFSSMTIKYRSTTTSV